MREALAERLLAEVMNWSPENVAQERPILQALANYKYDGYQQYSAGMHFIESLATWLTNFTSALERSDAYEFIKDRLVFISEGEMRQLVGLSYPDYIRPILINRASAELQVPNYLIHRILNSDAFQRAERRTLFLGLSDGARIDVFRRKAGLSNEQVHATYQLSVDKSKDMVQELRRDLSDSDVLEPHDRFNTVFLIDDFAGSGDSLLRQENGQAKGKLPACLHALHRQNDATGLLDLPSLSVYIVLYMSTDRAFDTLTTRLREPWAGKLHQCAIVPVYTLSDAITVTPSRDPKFDRLLSHYYDSGIMDKHLSKGGNDVIHGYARCSLPLVLPHNTPNNSVYLLWADKPGLRTKALFPRVSRHTEQ